MCRIIMTDADFSDASWVCFNLPIGAESAKPQMLLFSATVPYWVREVADKYMSHDRVVVDLIGGESLKTAVSVEHKAICCPYAERPSTIADVIQVRLKTHARTRVSPI